MHPIEPSKMSHWMAVGAILTLEERTKIIRHSTPSEMRYLVEQCSRYSAPEAAERIRQGRI